MQSNAKKGNQQNESLKHRYISNEINSMEQYDFTISIFWMS